MAGNEWINGYLEAILDSGVGTIEEQNPSSPKEKEERGHYNPTKYFVDEVVNGVDETDLYKTWIKVVATRNTRERSSRLENMCWRIWHLARKNKQLEWEGQQRLSKRRTEREGATVDVSEDLSESEKGDSLGDLIPCETPRFSILQRTISNVDLWPDDKDEKRMYIVLISLHGLVRGENMELGRDSDTGGQVKYVVELARALARMKGVYRVDLFTRQISSKEVDWSYGEPTEMLCSTSDDNERSDVGESSGAYVIRIPFGPRDEYLSKELLWPYIQEFVDGALSHIINMSKVLGEQIGKGKPVWPYVIHGHYADAGESAALLSGALNVPMVLTGHSLGRNKLEQLLKQGRQSREDINSTYKIMRRIEAEELSIDAAELVITSTEQEIDDQWGLYDGFDVKLERVLRARSKRGVDSHGRFMPKMAVIPPGMDFSNVVIQEENMDADVELPNEGSSPKSTPPVWSEIMRFLNNPHKPMILALSRPDPKKNLTTLLKAFGECRPLRELANLTLIMGNRDDIDEMSSGNASVLTSVLKLIDAYDLYGLVAYPKRHKQSDVPDIYRLAARTKGVFINPALVEPFGLTLIEAAAHGLPMVATKNGGPVDIQRALNNGLLVDPHDKQGIADALLKLVSERTLWHECRKNGWKNIHLYSWPEHCRAYLTRVGACRMRHAHWQTNMQGDETHTDPSLNDSLKEDHDICLKLSIDGEKSFFDAQDEAGKEERKSPNIETNGDKGEANKCSILRKKGKLIVFAVDSYNEDGNPDESMAKYVLEVVKVARSSMAGLAFSTAMPFKEVLDFMKSNKIEANDFDVMICSSGSEIYYSADEKFVQDQDYGPHIGFRWGYEGLKRTVWKLVGSFSTNSIQEDASSSNSYCISYLVKDTSKVMSAHEMRQKLRMRGLRCQPVYCRRASRMQIIPLLASRSMALRYLFVRWKINLESMHVIVGETGDTDYDRMLGGMHKTIIIKGVSHGSKDLIRPMEAREDIVPKDSPNVTLEDHIANIFK